MRWLVRGAKAHDSLFFHCTPLLLSFLIYLLTQPQFFADSGHGGQTRDLDGDEIDGYDEGQFQLFGFYL